MRPTKTMAAAIVAAAIPLYAGLYTSPAVAGPLSQSLALNSANVGPVEQVQYRRWGRGYYARRWGRGYYAYGAARRWGRGYYAYGAARRWGRGYYAYAAAPGYGLRYGIGDPNYGNGGAATTRLSDRRCTSDREEASSWPSWLCR